MTLADGPTDPETVLSALDAPLAGKEMNLYNKSFQRAEEWVRG